MKHYRIRGTSFELSGYAKFLAEDGWGYWHHPSGYQPMIPIEWVEAYEPPRKEPIVGAVEIGSNGSVYVRVKGYDKDSRWLWIHPGGDTGATTWEDMQSRVMPTKPMIVIPDDQ